MKETARLLCEDIGKGKSILNAGFGLSIVCFQCTTLTCRSCCRSIHISSRMSRSIILSSFEGYSQCLKYMQAKGWFDMPNIRILRGPWQDFIGPRADIKWPANGTGVIIEGVGKFDIIYFDTFNEGYPGHLKFLDCVPNLLSSLSARFSFFHGHCRNWKMGYEIDSGPNLLRSHLSIFFVLRCRYL